MKTLLFDQDASDTNNQFHVGLNVTVRNGTKYLSELEIGELVRLENLNNDLLAGANVHMMIVGPMISLPKDILDMEHDPKCRNINGLFEVMKHCYPDIKITDVVTAIVLDIAPGYEGID